MHVDLISIKIGIIRLAICVMDPNHALVLVDANTVSHQTALMQGWLSVHKHIIPVDKMSTHFIIHSTPINFFKLLCLSQSKLY